MKIISLAFLLATGVSAFHLPVVPSRNVNWRQSSSQLQMGLLDRFLGNREDDFVKLESSLDTFGPGPAMLLYGCPAGVTDDELKDMIEDGAPEATKAGVGGVICRRIDDATTSLLDMTVQGALEKVVKEGSKISSESIAGGGVTSQPACPVVYFSGISNAEMMATYRIISSEIYEETGGAANAACAKAVPPAMDKTLRQVVEEITGDHLDAISPDEGLNDYGA
mmetsp:Transcript_28015/g.80980  ORF Transcript_28015/g.80980 Transcript_28015/m.80980 type:complete len:223 (-) Transcript_28015:348-1016(-)